MNRLRIANNSFGRKKNKIKIMMKQDLFNSNDYVLDIFAKNYYFNLLLKLIKSKLL